MASEINWNKQCAIAACPVGYFEHIFETMLMASGFHLKRPIIEGRWSGVGPLMRAARNYVVFVKR